MILHEIDVQILSFINANFLVQFSERHIVVGENPSFYR